MRKVVFRFDQFGFSIIIMATSLLEYRHSLIDTVFYFKVGNWHHLMPCYYVYIGVCNFKLITGADV